MDVDQSAPMSAARENLAAPIPVRSVSGIPSLNDAARSSRPGTPSQPMAVRAAAGKSIPNSPRGPPGSQEQKSQPVMPPPSEPSQTLSAQELRETAKYSRSAGDRDIPLPTEPRAQGGNAPAPSPRHRSSSPMSRPGTRNPSQESRASGDRRSRGDKSDDKRGDRDTRQESREVSRRESRNERRAAREDRDKDGDRDRDRRDRHGDRDRRERDHPRERERDKERERDRDRDRGDGHRERERERDRDRDRDRHRRDEKDRERDGRKERDGSGRGPTAVSINAPSDDRGLPNRPETGRHRGEDSLGKRRRGGDEEVCLMRTALSQVFTHELNKADRSSKRASRKDSHHEDRSRRSSDKDGHDRAGRESDRRRKDRDGGDGDGKGLSIDTKVRVHHTSLLPLHLMIYCSWATNVLEMDQPLPRRCLPRPRLLLVL